MFVSTIIRSFFPKQNVECGVLKCPPPTASYWKLVKRLKISMNYENIHHNWGNKLNLKQTQIYKFFRQLIFGNCDLNFETGFHKKGIVKFVKKIIIMEKTV